MGTTARTDRPQQSAAQWRLDPPHSSADFRALSLCGASSVRGRFDPLDGYLDIDADGQRPVQLAIEASILDTGNRRRDEPLRSVEFFAREPHVELEPTARETQERLDLTTSSPGSAVKAAAFHRGGGRLCPSAT